MTQQLKSALIFGVLMCSISCFASKQHTAEAINPSPISQKNSQIKVKVPTILNDDKIRPTITAYLEKNNCRIATASDFTHSEKALAAINLSVGNYWIQTIAYDNFDNNLLLNDFAVMLINKEDSAPNNFRLVFFFEQEKGYTTFDLLDHANLTTSTMDKNRYGWYLTTYNGDGRIEKHCGFQWNAKTEKIECVKTQ